MNNRDLQRELLRISDRLTESDASILIEAAEVLSRTPGPATARVKSFFSFMLAGACLDRDVDSVDDLDGSLVCVSFMGNGASDMLRVDDIRAMLKE